MNLEQKQIKMSQKNAVYYSLFSLLSQSTQNYQSLDITAYIDLGLPTSVINYGNVLLAYSEAHLAGDRSINILPKVTLTSFKLTSNQPSRGLQRMLLKKIYLRSWAWISLERVLLNCLSTKYIYRILEVQHYCAQRVYKELNFVSLFAFSISKFLHWFLRYLE